MSQRPNRGNNATPTPSKINSVTLQAAVSTAVTAILAQIRNGNNGEGNEQGTGRTVKGQTTEPHYHAPTRTSPTPNLEPLM